MHSAKARGRRKGLGDEDVVRSRAAHGANVLTPPRRTPWWRLYLDKYKDPIIEILLVAAVISLIFAWYKGEYIETVGIFVAIFLATTIGFLFELDAAHKFDILTALDEDTAVKVRRDGKVTVVRRRDIVVGDVVLVEAGDEIPADGLLYTSGDMQVNESSLTGEPMAYKHLVTGKDSIYDKQIASTYPVDKLLRGTMVMDGRGEYVVTAVGDNTEIGRLARSSAMPTDVKTPLNIQLGKLAKLISKWGTTVSVAAFFIFLIHSILTDDVWLGGGDNIIECADIVLQYLMMAVTLIVMAAPEGLPMAITLSLALNMRRMLSTKNLVRKLHSCETMGAVTVICIDKTGTLTQNRMQVAEMYAMDGAANIAEAIALNSTACIDSNGTGIGNPTEAALLRWLRGEGIDYEEIRQITDIDWQLPFSPERKYMATMAVVGGRRLVFVKGAPEIMLAICGISPSDGSEITDKLSSYQHRAMRTLAFAVAECGSGDEPTPSSIQTYIKDVVSKKASAAGNLAFSLQAIAAISDPVRLDVPRAMGVCRVAGIEVKVVTGDNMDTAVEVARQAGIIDDSKMAEKGALITGSDFAAMSDDEAQEAAGRMIIMSRARPSDKQRLVDMLQRRGEVVAVTGDGTNDAPALRQAHVGLSLGSGTSVAKEASDMTLLDDSFHSIVTAVMWGRSLYINIQRFLFFQLTVNVSALLLVLGGAVVGTEMPLTITQILWVNLIMDTFAAMALASLPPSADVMYREPRRRDEPIVLPQIWKGILTVGGLQFVVMFAFFLHCLYLAVPGIQLHELTQFFTTFVMLQMWNLLNARCLRTNQSVFKGLSKAGGLIAVIVMIMVGQMLIVEFGGGMFRTESMSLKEWIFIIIVTGVLVVGCGEIYRSIRRKGGARKRNKVAAA